MDARISSWGALPLVAKSLLVLGAWPASPLAQTCAVVPDGLVGWWDADELFYDTPWGVNSARALGPNVWNHAHLENGTATAPGIVTSAFSLDGIDDFLALQSNGGLFDQTDALSVELWMKAGSTQPQPLAMLVDKSHIEAPNHSGWALAVVGATGVARFGYGDGAAFHWIDSSTDVLDGGWHHLAATFDRSKPLDNLELWVDGVREAVATTTSPIKVEPYGLILGKGQYSNEYYQGLIDEPSVYDRALTSQEIAAIHGALGAGKCRGRTRGSNGTLYQPYPQAAGARFGQVLDSDGDVLVATSYDDSLPISGWGKGTASIYRFDGTSWNHEQFLYDPAMSYPDDWFGLASAVSGDQVVFTSSSGRVRPYRFNGSSWVAEGSVNPNTGGVYWLWYPDAVDIDGGRIVAGHGGTYPTSSQPYVGVVFVYAWNGSAWVQEAKLTPPSPSPYMLFGLSVAIEGDTILVGAPGDDQAAGDAGAVYVYRHSGSTWALDTKLVPSDDPEGDGSFGGDAFGSAVDLSSGTALVGAPRDDFGYGIGQSGAAYVFVDAAGAFVHEATLRPNDASTNDHFGGAVSEGSGFLAEGHTALALSTDGDTAVVGSVTDTYPNGYLDPGSVYVFRRESRDGAPAWVERARLFHAPSEWLGQAVTITDDGTVFAGSHYHYEEVRSFDVADLLITNQAPVADAGPDQVVDEGTNVQLDGTGSYDVEGSPLSYQWTQLAGDAVALDDATSATPVFLAPSVPLGGATVTLQLVVSDGELESAADSVNITIKNVNQPPEADAGADQTVAEGAAVDLDGSGSWDPDGEAITFEWSQSAGPAVTLSDATSATPSFVAPLVGATGVDLTFLLQVSDGIDAAGDSVVVHVENVNHPPVADAGDDLTHDEGSLVYLDGTGSSDPDGDSLTYAWTQVSGPTVTLSDPLVVTPSFVAPDVLSGSDQLVFLLTVDDGLGGSASDTVTVSVLDVNTPPACALARPSVEMLWPPSHKLVRVRILGITDPDDDDVTVAVTGVMQDEPVNGIGMGDTDPDAVLQGDSVLIRAERAGSGNGRVYHISFTADDGTGGVCSGTVTVCVPHDRKKPQECVDDGPIYDSTLEVE